MLRPYARMLRTTVTVKAGTAKDKFQNTTYTTYTVKNVHIQPTNEIRKTASNTDCTLRSYLIADARHSTTLDWWGLFNAAHAIGVDVKVVANGQEYTVVSVDKLFDFNDNFHHWEIGLY